MRIYVRVRILTWPSVTAPGCIASQTSIPMTETRSACEHGLPKCQQSTSDAHLSMRGASGECATPHVFTQYLILLYSHLTAERACRWISRVSQALIVQELHLSIEQLSCLPLPHSSMTCLEDRPAINP